MSLAVEQRQSSIDYVPINVIFSEEGYLKNFVGQIVIGTFDNILSNLGVEIKTNFNDRENVRTLIFKNIFFRWYRGEVVLLDEAQMQECMKKIEAKIDELSIQYPGIKALWDRRNIHPTYINR